jgi:hypothetical protein
LSFILLNFKAILYVYFVLMTGANLYLRPS